MKFDDQLVPRPCGDCNAEPGELHDRHCDKENRTRLLAELARLRAIETAARAHLAAWQAWREWRPAAGMGHGFADRYAATRDALWATLGVADEGAIQ